MDDDQVDVIERDWDGARDIESEDTDDASSFCNRDNAGLNHFNGDAAGEKGVVCAAEGGRFFLVEMGDDIAGDVLGRCEE